MRRAVLLAMSVLLLGTGCATARAPRTAPAGSGAVASPSAGPDADIFAAVLRRYVSNGGENSFGDHRFPVVYVLDRTDPRAADPMRATGPAAGALIPPADQQRIVAAVSDLTALRFVSSREEVVAPDAHGCAPVRDGKMLILLGPPTGGSGRVEVGINGFVSCDGATWLTYVVSREVDGWTVTGTTGPMANS